ncbi:MAG: hypothetical protein EAZ53_05240 [Bacteroidetes bacterium]|nr:MAG: hypothetical protein EAZ53_05240 [Bacteroidota bacterium]
MGKYTQYALLFLGIVFLGSCKTSSKSGCNVKFTDQTNVGPKSRTFPYPCLCTDCDNADADYFTKCDEYKLYFCYRIVSSSNHSDAKPDYEFTRANCEGDGACNFEDLDPKCYYPIELNKNGSIKPIIGPYNHKEVIMAKKSDISIIGTANTVVYKDFDYQEWAYKKILYDDFPCNGGTLYKKIDLKYPFDGTVGCIPNLNARTEEATKVEVLCNSGSSTYYISENTKNQDYVYGRPMLFNFNITNFSEMQGYGLVLKDQLGAIIDYSIIDSSPESREKIKTFTKFDANKSASGTAILLAKTSGLNFTVSILSFPKNISYPCTTPGAYGGVYTGSNSTYCLKKNTNLQSATEIQGSSINIDILPAQQFETYGSTNFNVTDRFFNIVNIANNSSYNLFNLKAGQKTFEEAVNFAFDTDSDKNTLDAHIRTKITTSNINEYLIDADGNIILDAAFINDYIDINISTSVLFTRALQDWYYKVLSVMSSNTSLVKEGFYGANKSFNCFNYNDITKLYFKNLNYLVLAKGFKVFDFSKSKEGVLEPDLTSLIGTYFSTACQNGSCETARTLKFQFLDNNLGKIRPLTPLCVVFANAQDILGLNTDRDRISDALHEMGHGWTFHMEELFLDDNNPTKVPCYANNTAASHSQYCNGYGKQWCLFRYWEGSGFTTEEFRNKRSNSLEFCEGHRNILINRLSVHGYDCE